MTGSARSVATNESAELKNPVVDLLMLTMMGSGLEAFVFVVVMTCTLPASDMAHGSSPFSDPLAFQVGMIVALVLGLLIFPFSFWLLRRTRLGPSFGRLLAPGLGIILVLTPTLQAFEIPGVLCVPLALLATVGAMFYCRKRFPLTDVSQLD